MQKNRHLKIYECILEINAELYRYAHIRNAMFHQMERELENMAVTILLRYGNPSALCGYLLCALCVDGLFLRRLHVSSIICFFHLHLSVS